MEPRIQYAKTEDGVSIVYAVSGAGLPIVLCPAFVERFSLLGQLHPWAQFLSRLSEGMLRLQFDQHGVGLSQRAVEDFSLESRVRDLEAVVRAVRLRQFALYGTLLSGSTAIAYAARHPRSVSHLILYGTFSRGVDVMPWEQLGPLTELARNNWEMAAQLFADLSTRQQFPEIALQVAENFRAAATGAVVADILSQGYKGDVSGLLPEIKTPTLVLHRREDPVVPFALGQALAAAIPDARLVPLEGSVHAEFLGDSGPIIEAVRAFLNAGPTARPRPSSAAPTADIVTILFTDIEDSTALTQRLGDAKAQELVRAHNGIVREALRAHNGTEIKHTGDGIMASFHSASGALECAAAIQRAVHERGGGDLRVRIGLNSGEPVEEESDLFGTAVQLARRICDAAEGGEILASDVVRQLAAGKGFLFAGRGEVALRGFEDPVRLFEVRWNEGSS